MPVASDLVCLIAFEMDAAGDRTRPGASGQRAAVRRSAEGPSAPCPTPSTLVRPGVATALPAGGPRGVQDVAVPGGRGRERRRVAPRAGPGLRRRGRGPARRAGLPRARRQAPGRAWRVGGQRPAGDAAPAAATSSTAAAAPVMQPVKCPVRSVNKPTTRNHGPHRVAQQRPPSPRWQRDPLVDKSRLCTKRDNRRGLITAPTAHAEKAP